MITEMFMPKNGMDMTEGTIVRWLKAEGERVEADEPIMEIETDKITMEAEAPGSGILLKKLYNDGDTVPVLTVIGYIGESGDKLPEGSGAADAGQPAAEADTQDSAPAKGRDARGAFVAATPYARQLASEKGLPLSCVAPTGTDGQILGHDVAKAANSTGVARAMAAETGAKLNEISGSGEGGRVRKADLTGRDEAPSAVPAAGAAPQRRPLTPMRKVIAKRMYESHANIPTVTQNTRVDVTRLMQLRKELNGDKESRVSVNDFVIRAVALAVTENERIRMQFSGAEYTLLDRTNVGVAVSTKDGLLVPVIHDADKKTLSQLSAEVKELAASARSGGLKKEQLGDARITITNLGMFGVHSFTPIINEPEAAILGVSAAEDYLILNERKEVEARKRMMLCLTYDHRILNGTEAAEFSNRVKFLLEHPYALLS